MNMKCFAKHFISKNFQVFFLCESLLAALLFFIFIYFFYLFFFFLGGGLYKYVILIERFPCSDILHVFCW